MKVKFEIEVDEKTFDEISDNAMSNNFNVDLSLLIGKRKFVMKTFGKENNPIIHYGPRGAGIKTKGIPTGSIELIETH